MKIHAGILPVLLMSTGLSGCIFGGKKPQKVASPVHPAPQPVTAPTPRPADDSGLAGVGIAAAPTVATPASPAPVIPLPELPPTDKPAVTPPPRRPPRPRQPAPNPTIPPPADQQTIPAPVPVPKLGEILSDAERRQAETEMASHLTRARDILARASRVSLNTGQVETRERVRIFIQQAESARGSDLPTALQLALRADVLAQDLLPALR
jgi:hypothetical protein